MISNLITYLIKLPNEEKKEQQQEKQEQEQKQQELLPDASQF